MTALERLVHRAVSRAFASLDNVVDQISDVAWNAALYGLGRGTGEVEAGGDYVGHYGFQSYAPDGGDAVVLRVAGKGNNSFIVGYRFRGAEVSLEKGEVIVIDDLGQKLHLKRSGVAIDGQEIILAGGTMGAVRVGDRIDGSLEFFTMLSEIIAAINALAPGAVTPMAGTRIGVAAEGSSTVVIG